MPFDNWIGINVDCPPNKYIWFPTSVMEAFSRTGQDYPRTLRGYHVLFLTSNMLKSWNIYYYLHPPYIKRYRFFRRVDIWLSRANGIFPYCGTVAQSVPLKAKQSFDSCIINNWKLKHICEYVVIIEYYLLVCTASPDI